MALHLSRVSRIEIVSILCILPLIAWLILYLGQRWIQLDLRPTLPWLKTLRWMAWIIGMVLLLLSLTGGRLHWAYGVAMATFSSGLSIPESWIKHRSLNFYRHD